MDKEQDFNKEEHSLLDYILYLGLFGLSIFLVCKCLKKEDNKKKKIKQNINNRHNSGLNNDNDNIYNQFNKNQQFNNKNFYNDNYNLNNNIQNYNYSNFNNYNNNNTSHCNNNNYNMGFNNNYNNYNRKTQFENFPEFYSNSNNNNNNNILYNNINKNSHNDNEQYTNRNYFNYEFENNKNEFNQNENHINENHINENHINENHINERNKPSKRLSGKKRNSPDNSDNQENENIIEDKNKNLQAKNPFEKIAPEIKKEPKIGLNNIGATCYMNATLQCLSHTIKLTQYFFDPKHQNFINSDENILSSYYLEVLKKLWFKKYNNNKSNYSPTDFKNIISQMDPLFQGVAANDSKDLINFILQQLHLELNKNKDNKTNNQNQGNNAFNLNQFNESEVFSFFLNDYRKNHRSIISDIFYGIIETKTECLQCKQRNQLNGVFNPLCSYNFQIISFIIFPLEEVRKFKHQIYNINSNEVTLDDCFEYYQKEEIMAGDNQMWCKFCGQNTNSKYCTKIYSSPHYFILILNRGKGNIFNVKLNFQEIIEISKYVQKKSAPNLLYQLYAIVTHLGPSSMSGHFIAFCKSPIDSLWYKYNDSQVDLVGNFFQDIHEFGCPYILFYERL